MVTVLGDEGESGDREEVLRQFCPRSMAEYRHDHAVGD